MTQQKHLTEGLVEQLLMSANVGGLKLAPPPPPPPRVQVKRLISFFMETERGLGSPWMSRFGNPRNKRGESVDIVMSVFAGPSEKELADPSWDAGRAHRYWGDYLLLCEDGKKRTKKYRMACGKCGALADYWSINIFEGDKVRAFPTCYKCGAHVEFQHPATRAKLSGTVEVRDNLCVVSGRRTETYMLRDAATSWIPGLTQIKEGGSLSTGTVQMHPGMPRMLRAYMGSLVESAKSGDFGTIPLVPFTEADSIVSDMCSIDRADYWEDHIPRQFGVFGKDKGGNPTAPGKWTPVTPLEKESAKRWEEQGLQGRPWNLLAKARNMACSRQWVMQGMIPEIGQEGAITFTAGWVPEDTAAKFMFEHREHEAREVARVMPSNE